MAAFAAAPREGKVPLQVSFNDESTGDVSSYLWDFGNGYLSTLANPTFAYAEPGAYTVQLTVSGPEGTSSHTEIAFITALPRRPSAKPADAPTSVVETETGR